MQRSDIQTRAPPHPVSPQGNCPLCRRAIVTNGWKEVRVGARRREAAQVQPDELEMNPQQEQEREEARLAEARRRRRLRTAQQQAQEVSAARADPGMSARALVEANKKIDWGSLVVALREVGAEFSDAAVDAMKSLDVTYEGTRARRGAIGPLVTILWDGSWAAKEQAARAVRNLASTDENRVMMAKAGMIDAIVALLREGPKECAEAACGALDQLALNEDNQVAIAKTGAIEPLVFVLERGTEEGATSAARALWNLAANEDNQQAIAAYGAIPPLVDLSKYGEADGCEAATWALRNLAAHSDNQLTIAEAGALEVLAEILASDAKVGCREAAAGCLRNLALNGPGAQKAIAELGVIPGIIDLLDEATMDGREEAAGALRNLAWKDAQIGVRAGPPCDLTTPALVLAFLAKSARGGLESDSLTRLTSLCPAFRLIASPQPRAG